MNDQKKPPQFNYLLPPEECERMYLALGGPPGLDPCGHPDQALRAGRMMFGDSADDDGFALAWSPYRTVVLNAPHGEREPNWDELEAANPGWTRPRWAWRSFSKWLAKASVEAQRGCTVLAFMPASTDRKWFHQYIAEATSIAFLEQRVKCYVPTEGHGDAPTRCAQPMTAHMAVLWTKDADIAEAFFNAYKTRGMIVEPRPVGA